MSLASRIASSSVSKETTGATGPKISSRSSVRLRRHLGQHGRLVEAALGSGRPPPVTTVAPLATASRDQLVDLVDRLAVDQRPDLDAVGGAGAHRERRHPVGQPSRELLRDRRLDVDPVGGGAGLARVAHLGDHRPLDRGVEVGVGEDQERGVAAELHGDVDHPVGRLAEQHPADLGRPGERELADPVVVQHRRHDGARAPGGQHVDHPVRHPGLGQQPGQRERGQRGVAGGLEHHRAPAASAGPILRVAIAAGKFHGVTSTQTPIGRY